MAANILSTHISHKIRRLVSCATAIFLALGALFALPRPLVQAATLSITPSNLTGSNVQGSGNSLILSSGSGVNEVQTVSATAAGVDATVTVPATGLGAGGTFSIARGDSAATVQANAAALAAIGSTANLAVSGGTNPSGAISQTSRTAPVTTNAGTSSVYDPAHQKVYIFGGNDTNTNTATSNAILIYDVTTRALTTSSAVLPSARSYTSAVFNPATGKAYIFGGCSGTTRYCPSGSYYSSILEYDATNDTLATKSATLPGSRGLTSAVFNPSTGMAYVFGGYNGSAALSSIVQYDVTNDVATTMASTLPSTRAATSAAYDPSAQKAYIFGGSSNGSLSGTTSIYVYDTTNDGISTESATLPSSRGWTAASFDPISGKAYVFGGAPSGSQNFQDILKYDPVAHTVSTQVSKLSYNLMASAGSTSVDPSTGTIYYIGEPGVDSYDPSSDTLYSSVGGQRSIYDPTTGKIYMISLIGNSGHMIEYDPSTNTYITKSAPMPLQRGSVGSLVLDPTAQQIYIIGGADALHGRIVSNLIYRYDIASDTIATMSATLPTAEEDAGVVYNPATNKAYIFGQGGSGNQIAEYNMNNDTIALKSATLPAGLQGSAAAVNPSTNKAYLFGGIVGSTSYNTIIEYDVTNDVVTTKTAVLPSARHYATATFNPNTGLFRIFGGATGAGFANDILAYNAVTDTITADTTTLPSNLTNVGGGIGMTNSATIDPLTGITYITNGIYVYAYDPSGTGSYAGVYTFTFQGALATTDISQMTVATAGWAAGTLTNGGSGTYAASGLGHIQEQPVPGTKVHWQSSTPSSTIPASTSVSLTYSSDGGSAYGSAISSLPPSETLDVKAALATTDTSVTPSLDSLDITYQPITASTTAPTLAASYLVGSGTGAVSSVPFTWTVTDTYGTDHILTEFSTNGGSTWTTLSDTLAPSQTSDSWVPDPGTSTSTAKLRISLIDPFDAVLATATTPQFSVQTNALPTASPLTPAGGAAFNNGDNVSFSATIADTDAGDTVTADYQLATDSGFSTVVDSVTAQAVSLTAGSGTFSHNHTLSPASATTYYWHVRATDSFGAQSAWTTTRTFTVTGPNQPPTVGSLGPVNRTDGSLTNQTQPSLTFTTADPDSGDTVKYQVIVSVNSNYSAPAVDYTSVLAAPGASSFTVGQAAASGTYAAGTAGQSLADGTYYWRVRSLDSHGASSSYAAANAGGAFTVDATAPSFGSVTAVSNNAHTDVAKNGDTVTVTFTRSEALAANPTVTLGGKAMTFSSLVSTTYTYTRVIDGTETESATSPLAISGSDLAGNAGSGSGSFALDFTAPGLSTGVTVTPSTISETAVTVSWTDPTAPDLATLQVYRSLVSGSLGGQVATIAAGTQSFADSGLTRGTQYYYTIKSLDRAGNLSGPSAQASGSPQVVATALILLMPGEAFTNGSGVTGSALNQLAGTAFTVQVLAVDAQYNLATSATPAVSFSSIDSLAVLPAPGNLSGGTASFVVTMGTEGSQSLTVGGGLPPVTHPVTVLAATPTPAPTATPTPAPTSTPAPTPTTTPSPSPTATPTPSSTPTPARATPSPTPTATSSPAPAATATPAPTAAETPTPAAIASPEPSGPSITLTVTPIQLPASPSFPGQPTPSPTVGATLTWNIPSTPPKGYRIYRSFDPSVPTDETDLLATIDDPSATTYIDRTFSDTARLVYYRVEAIQDAGATPITSNVASTGRTATADSHPWRIPSIAIASLSTLVGIGIAGSNAVASALAFGTGEPGLRELWAWVLGASRRRRRRWGSVITSDGDAPMVGVEVLLTNLSGDIVYRTLTDRSGAYSFYLEKPGTYHVKTANLHGYRLAHAVTLTVDDPEKVLGGMNLVLKPVASHLQKTSRAIKRMVSLRNLLEGIQIPLMLLGTGLTVWDVITDPHYALTWIMAALYVLLWGYQLNSLRQVRGYGLTLDQHDGKPLFNAELKLYAAGQDGTSLVATKVSLSDQRGRYRMLVPEGRHVLFATHPGYLFHKGAPQEYLKSKPANENIRLAPESTFLES